MKRSGILLAAFTLITLGNLRAQNIAEIAKSDPLIITGAVGTQNTYYHSSSGNGSMSPLSNSVYANLNFSVYGINMPFSFYYSNNNTSFSYPHFSFDISPTYKNWTLHLGRRSMPFSNYIYNLPFYGVGIEYNNPQNHLRLGAFYGQLQKSINDDPTDPAARNPQYERRGWGFKMGYGSSRNYLDLYLFRAKDRLASLDDRWYDQISPQENIAVGLKGRFSIKRFLTLNANLAASLFSTDYTSSKLETAQASKWENLFDSRYSTLYRFAGDVNMALTLRGFNLLASYKMIQPDFSTLGISYTSNNLQSLGVSASSSLFRQRLNLSGSFSGQEDNLSGEQLFTTRGFVYTANANLRLTKSFNVNAAYNGYLQRQYDGTAVVNDTTRVNRRMNSFTLTPSYSFGPKLYAQSVGLSYNYSQNEDLNPFNEGESDVTTHAIGANYNIDVSPIETLFNLSYNHQQSRTFASQFSSDMISLGASRSFLEEKNLSASATLSASWNTMNSQRTFSMGAYANAGYTMRKVHTLGLSTSVNKYEDFYFSDNTVYRGFDFTFSLNYNYTFSLWSIKRKAEQIGDTDSSAATKQKHTPQEAPANAIDRKRLFK